MLEKLRRPWFPLSLLLSFSLSLSLEMQNLVVPSVSLSLSLLSRWWLYQRLRGRFRASISHAKWIFLSSQRNSFYKNSTIISYRNDSSLMLEARNGLIISFNLRYLSKRQNQTPFLKIPHFSKHIARERGLRLFLLTRN